MKNNTKKVIRFTSISEYKTLEKYLEKMAAKGLLLSEIKRNSLIFRKITPRELDFNVSLFYHTTPFDYPNTEKDKDYRELCEESGWHFCTSNEVYQIFYKEKDEEVIPIHTDPQEEYKIVKSIFMKTDFVSMMLLLLVVGMGLIQTLNFDYEDLFSNATLFSTISPIFLIIIVLSLYIYPVTWLIKNKINLSRGKELTFSTNKARLIRNIITWSLISVYFLITIFSVTNGFTNAFMGILGFIPVLVSILIAKYCVKRFKTKKHTRKYNIVFFSIITLFTTIIVTLSMVMAIMFSLGKFDEDDDRSKEIAVLELLDLGTNARPERTRTHEKSSILVPVYFEYYESLGRKPKDNEIGSVRSTYIYCRNKAIADYVFDGYMKEEQEWVQERISEYLEFRYEEKAKEEENNISKVTNDLWHVDRGYYLYDSKSKVIIQKDNVIYILFSDVDFSEKEIVDKCIEKFEL